MIEPGVESDMLICSEPLKLEPSGETRGIVGAGGAVAPVVDAGSGRPEMTGSSWATSEDEPLKTAMTTAVIMMARRRRDRCDGLKAGGNCARIKSQPLSIRLGGVSRGGRLEIAGTIAPLES